MIQLGQRCSGEKHSDTITNQREAITQLRRQLNELELAKPPGWLPPRPCSCAYYTLMQLLLTQYTTVTLLEP